MDVEPASPLPFHLVANSAALLVFDEWNDFFPSPVVYSINGESQVYWDVAYTFDKFQQEGKAENIPLRKFLSQMRRWQHHTVSWEALPFTSLATCKGHVFCFCCPNSVKCWPNKHYPSSPSLTGQGFFRRTWPRQHLSSCS